MRRAILRRSRRAFSRVSTAFLLRNGYDDGAQAVAESSSVEKSLEQIFRIGQDPQALPGVLDGVEEFCHVRGIAPETALEVRLVTEEVLTNFVKYAHVANEEGVLELRLAASSESVRLEFRDEGTPFNPLAAPVPDLSGSPDERTVGGLGVLLVRTLVDDATYVREGSVNTLVLIKHVGSAV